MLYSSPNSAHYYQNDAAYSPRSSIVYILISIVSSFVAFFSLYLPWYDYSPMYGALSLALPVIVGLNVLCYILFAWQVTRLISVLIWGINVFLMAVALFIVIPYLFQQPVFFGPIVCFLALVATLMSDIRVRWRYPLPEFLTIPAGEETLRPPF